MDKKHKADEKRVAKKLKKSQDSTPINEPVEPVDGPPNENHN